MDFEFLPSARQELTDAYDYYERQRLGLGDEFRDEIDRTLQRICEDPTSYESVSERMRRCATRRFPYALIYEPLEEKVVVAVVMHLHRHPNYWTDRV